MDFVLLLAIGGDRGYVRVGGHPIHRIGLLTIVDLGEGRRLPRMAGEGQVEALPRPGLSGRSQISYPTCNGAVATAGRAPLAD